MNTVKFLGTNKYEIEMFKDQSDSYLVTTTVYGVNQPITMVKTKDFDYASRLFDTLVSNIKTVYIGDKV